ncbi:hypothetical protein K435DRAFT_283215 [Dendrothele bispora CBS 962.96]|uniref:DUF6534 domain-containing protein n=1 Tax=Dendrothele bispora (strain CBS 962.96) TaxID=1314807 RepID=A0A4S8LLX5_DENBC|nr:hypothetical protein K435DRAFT_283215 [Dendrothele bispora CBS 962.96]
MSTPGFNPNLMIGPLILGNTLSSVLFGILTLQTYLYYGNFPNDPRRNKIAVAAVWILECGHFICTFVETWIDAVTHFGEITIYFLIPRVLAVSLLIAGLVLSIFTLMFADRIYRMSNNKYIFVFLCIASAVRLLASTANYIAIWRSEDILEYLDRWNWAIPAQLGLGLLTDLVITLSLVIYLKKQNRTMNHSTMRIVDTLVWWSIESGCSTVVLGIATLLTMIYLPHTYIWISMLLIITRVYSNVLLASLNGRAKLRALKRTSVILSTDPQFPTEAPSHGDIYLMTASKASVSAQAI